MNTRFERGTGAMAMLSHPGIVGLVDRGRAGSTLFYAMELSTVSICAAWRKQPLTPSAAVRLLATLCEP